MKSTADILIWVSTKYCLFVIIVYFLLHFLSFCLTVSLKHLTGNPVNLKLDVRRGASCARHLKPQLGLTDDATQFPKQKSPCFHLPLSLRTPNPA